MQNVPFCNPKRNILTAKRLRRTPRHGANGRRNADLWKPKIFLPIILNT